VTVGKDVLVSGAGLIGLFNVMVAKALGTNQVIVTGIQINSGKNSFTSIKMY
jgi:threonine dehydrogenase-like Zn-dependent dehydrogenase